VALNLRAVQQAQGLAEERERAQLEPEHLLESLIAQEEGIVAPLLRKLGVSPQALRSELQKREAEQPRVQGGRTSLSPRLDAVFRQASKEADQFKDEYVSVEHILLALAEPCTGTVTEETPPEACCELAIRAAINGVEL
jgi:ATP-dependent Clp protease ATP-binding subunit ClpB